MHLPYIDIMPSLEPNYPPPSNEEGAVIQPRQLNRWLDINPQGGALSRTHKYLTIPAFTSVDRWDGYSQIVTSFNCEAPNNFSLKPFSAPANPNFVLCISYRVGETVTRYLLWDAVGSEMPYFPLYEGQLIKKNFRLEVWNTAQGVASNASDIYIYTSVLGGKDYMYADDSVLKAFDAQVTNFWYNATAIPDVTAQGTILARYLSTEGFNPGVSWDSTDAIDQLFSTTCHTEEITTRYQQFLAALSGVDTLIGTAQGAVNYLFVAFQYVPMVGADNDGIIAFYDNSYEVRQAITGGVNSITVNGTELVNSANLIEGDIYLLVCVAGVQAFLFNVHTGVSTAPTALGISITPTSACVVDDGVQKCKVLDVLPMFDITGSFQDIYNYYFYTYNGPFLLPLVMPVNSISVTN